MVITSPGDTLEQTFVTGCSVDVDQNLINS